MPTKKSAEFKREAVNLALTSGLSHKQVASDLGIGQSPLSKWLRDYRDSSVQTQADEGLEAKLRRLRKENPILPRKGYCLFREPKVKRFAFVDANCYTFSIKTMCRVFSVTQRGYRAWRLRSVSRHQRQDMVIIDLYSRRVIGWAASDRMKKDLAIRALEMAINLQQPPPGYVHHTDRSSQYCSHAY